MNIRFKFLIWEVNFNLNKKKNNDRIEYLALKLLDELKDQGYTIASTTSKTDYICIFKFDNESLHIDSGDTNIIIKLKEMLK